MKFKNSTFRFFSKIALLFVLMLLATVIKGKRDIQRTNAEDINKSLSQVEELAETK